MSNKELRTAEVFGGFKTELAKNNPIRSKQLICLTNIEDGTATLLLFGIPCSIFRLLLHIIFVSAMSREVVGGFGDE